MKTIHLFRKGVSFFLFSFLIANTSFGQKCPMHHEAQTSGTNKNLTDLTFCNTQSSYADYGNTYYVPNADDEVLIIPVNIHVMQKTGSNPENFQDTQEHQQFFDQWINQYLSDKAFRNPGNSELCLGNITSAPLSVDSRIQFELDSVYFHQDSIGWKNNEKVTNSYVADNYLTGNESYYDELNIFLIEQRITYNNNAGWDADGIGWGGFGAPGTKLYVIMNEIYTKWIESGKQNWLSTGVLSHEIAHSFGLHHVESTQNALFDFECESMEWNGNNSCMGYNGQQNYFSPLQVAHMRRRLLTTWRKKFIKSNTYTYGQAPLIISSNTDFDSQIVWHGDIVIEDGASLNVNSTLHMSEGFKITVEPGGRLSVNQGGEITSCCGFWDGVYAYGDLSLPQTNVPAQALVRVREGGIIEHAENGIGIIDGALGLFTNAVFVNNKKAIDFSEYSASNFSHIRSCSFTINDDYLDLPNISAARQVNMSLVRSIEIKNSTFSNTSGERGGTGIMSMDAGYEVYSENGQSRFSGWEHGINAKGGCSINTFDVHDSDFSQCDIGILVESVDNFKTNDNNFKLCFNPSPDPGQGNPTSEIGIMTDFCTGYDIAFNTFTGYNAGNSSNNDQPIGTLIKDSGNQPNKVEVNDFTGCYIANLSNGDNRGVISKAGLKYLCNTQTSNINDIVIPLEAGNFGIAHFQGSNLNPAGNTFSMITSPLSGKNILNNDFTGPQDYLRYYYQGNVPAEFPNQVVGTDRIITFNNPACRQALVGGGGPGDGGGMIGDGGKSMTPANNLQSFEDAYKQALTSTEWANATLDEQAVLSKLKSDYYQRINQGLAAQGLSEKRNYKMYTDLLSKKTPEESKYLQLALYLEQDKITEANQMISELSDEDVFLYSIYANAIENHQSWKELSTDQINDLNSFASNDKRSSLIALNVLEYYFDEEYAKSILIPEIKGSTESIVEKSKDENFISIVPNPSAGRSTLNFNESSSGNYQLVNSMGQSQLTRKFQDQSEVSLDLSRLDKGTYFVIIVLLDGTRYTRKIITQ